MEKKVVTTKILAITGTIFVCFPILATLVLSTAFFIRAGFLRIDYLTPAEFFPVALLGGALLVWAAVRARLYLKAIAWVIGILAASLLASFGLAVITGLAAGEMEAQGVWFGIVVALLAVYTLALILGGVSGILLLKDLFKPKPATSQPV